MAEAPGGRGVLLVAGLVAAGLVFTLLARDRSAPPMGTGSQAPAFSLAPPGGGEPLRLAALRGRVVFVNFWATWCKPCEDEMPAMERLYARFRGDDFEMVAISVDDGSEEVQAFGKRLGLSFPILHDSDREVSLRYQAYRYPETFLLDRDGVVVTRFIGPRDWDAPPYVELIRKLIAGES